MDRLTDIFAALMALMMIPIVIILGIVFWIALIQVIGALLFGWPFPVLFD